jgi:hypothetical protein
MRKPSYRTVKRLNTLHYRVYTLPVGSHHLMLITKRPIVGTADKYGQSFKNFPVSEKDQTPIHNPYDLVWLT